MQYQLNFTFDDKALKAIYASDQSVTIVKSVVSSPLASGNLPIAWITFQPLESDSVTWQENYDIYATTTQMQAGAQIVMTSVTSEPVQVSQTYTFAQGMFTASAGGAPTAFTTTNSSGFTYSFGLSQQAMVNNVNVNAPLNAVTILNGESGTFTPEETISIFLSNTSNNGVVLSQIAGTALSVTLTSQSPTADIGFTDSNSSFYLQSTPSAFASTPLYKRLQSTHRR